MTYLQYQKTQHTNTNESRHSGMDPMWKNPIQKL